MEMKNTSNVDNFSECDGELIMKKQISNYYNTDKLRSYTQSTTRGVGIFLEPNPSKRNSMEDYVNIQGFKKSRTALMRGELFVLCDGHGGNKAAEIVVRDLPKIYERNEMDVKKKNSDSDETRNTFNTITKTFKRLDRELKKNNANGEFTSCGTTLNTILIKPENDKRVIYSGNVGDSRAILVSNGSVKRLSYDHKGSDKSEQRRVRSEGGIISSNRLYRVLAVTRALGDFEFKDELKGLSNVPYISKTTIDEENDKFIVIASDGLWDVVEDEVAHSLVMTNQKKTCEMIASELVDYAMKNGTKDNISCIVIRL